MLQIRGNWSINQDSENSIRVQYDATNAEVSSRLE